MRHWMRAGVLGGAALMAAQMAVSGAGWAQESGEPAPSAADEAANAAPEAAPVRKNRFLDEIVVTAQKREEQVQDVPVSVSAFSADLLSARGVSDQRDLQFLTPGLDVGTQVGYTTVFLRGVGSDAFVTADPSVALYIDGVYFPFAQGLAQDFGAVERVEVLKGPQGTLFGRNAVGGAINVIARSPSFEEWEASVQGSYGTFKDVRLQAHVNAPIFDNLAVSVSALYNNADNYYDGVAGGEPLGKETSKGLRGKLRFAPIENLEVELAGFFLKVGGVGSIFQLNENPSTLFQGIIAPQPGYEGEVDAHSYTDVENRVLYGSLKYFAPWFDVKLLISDQFIDTAGTYDFDGSPVPLVEFSPASQYADIQTGEIQIVSNENSWGADWLKWIAGAYYYSGDQGFDPMHLNVAGIDLAAGRLAGVTLPSALIDPVYSLLGSLGNAVGLGIPTGAIYLVATVDTTSISGFFQATADITDWFAITVGGRYQVETREIIESSAGLTAADGSRAAYLFNFQTARDDAGNVVPLEHTTTSFNPKVSAEFRPLEDVLVYATYQEATKSATYNALSIYLPPSFVRPEETTAYEVGVKTQFFDRTLTINGAYFRYKSEDLQVQFISLLQGGAIAFENAPEAVSQGFDFDVTWLVWPGLVDDLVLAFGGCFLDSTYTDFPNGTGFDEDGFYSTNNDYTGNDIIRSPAFTATASLAKTFQFNFGSFELSGDMYYNSGFFYAASNSARSEQPSYMTFGARASFLYEKWNLRATVWAKNLTDKQFTTGSLPTDFGNLVTLAPPRTVGLRINWNY